VANFLQGALLVEYVFGKHFVDAESMPKKSIMKPLRISLLIVLLLVALMQLTGVPLTPQ
jgi:glycerol uptake facilitator-like aquaporin